MSAGGAGTDHSSVLIPAVNQWGIRLYFYAVEGRKYDLHFAAYKGDMAGIKVCKNIEI